MIKKLMNNRYNEVKKKLENKELIILDGATGSELENRGIEMDNTWCGTASLQKDVLNKYIKIIYLLELKSLQRIHMLPVVCY
jgi:methionine synthase I (cobalamin-dependent)